MKRFSLISLFLLACSSTATIDGMDRLGEGGASGASGDAGIPPTNFGGSQTVTGGSTSTGNQSGVQPPEAGGNQPITTGGTNTGGSKPVSTDSPNNCTPRSCDDYLNEMFSYETNHRSCGLISDLCGGYVDCGGCPTRHTCGDPLYLPDHSTPQKLEGICGGNCRVIESLMDSCTYNNHTYAFSGDDFWDLVECNYRAEMKSYDPNTEQFDVLGNMPTTEGYEKCVQIAEGETYIHCCRK